MKWGLTIFLMFFQILAFANQDVIPFSRPSNQGDSKRFKMNIQAEEVIHIKTNDSSLNTTKSQLITIETGGIVHVDRVNPWGNATRITFKLANVKATFSGRPIPNSLSKQKIVANLEGKDPLFINTSGAPLSRDEQTILSMIFRPANRETVNSLFGADTEQLKKRWFPPKETLLKVMQAENVLADERNLVCVAEAKAEDFHGKPHLLVHYKAHSVNQPQYKLEFEIFTLLPKDKAQQERKVKRRYKFTTIEDLSITDSPVPMPAGSRLERTSYNNIEAEFIPANETFKETSTQQ